MNKSLIAGAALLAAMLPSPAVAGSSGELVYVANADAGPVTAYAAGSVGAAAPSDSVADPQKPNTVWDPWGVTFDTGKNLYVQTFLSDATTFVFAPGTSGVSRIFRVNGPDSRAITVDASGFEHVANGESGAVISVAAPGANGSPANLYTVAELRQIPSGDATFAPWPDILTSDNAGHVIVAAAGGTANSIAVFNAGPTGSNTPVRVITGPHTGLGSCAGFGNCDHVSITYSPFTGRIYAAVSGLGPTHISVFAGNAGGDATPVRTIAGPATGLSGQVVTGIADSQVDGSIYAMVKSTQFGGSGAIKVFDRLASGNVAPLRSFTDATTGFADAQGIAITSGP